MSAGVVSRGGIRFEFRPGVDPGFEWRAAMRHHDGYGPTIEDAAASLVEQIEGELEDAKRSLVTLREKAKP